MPIYEYTCDNCSSDFELLVRGAEQPACPACGANDLQRRMSVVAAPSAGTQNLPVRQPSMPAGGCGLPQCGTGGCQGMRD